MKKFRKFCLILIILLFPLYMLVSPVKAIGTSDDTYYEEQTEETPINGSVGLVLVFVGVLVVIILREALKAKKNINYNSMSTDVDSKIIEDSGRERVEHVEVLDNNYDEVIGKLIPGYDEKSLLDELYHKFIRVDQCICEGDISSLKELCTKELYEQYENRDLDESLQVRDYKLVDSAIRNIEEIDEKVVIDMYLNVSYDEEDKTFQKKYDLEFTLDNGCSDICSHCGAKLTGSVCEYCNSPVEEELNDFILSKKSLIHS